MARSDTGRGAVSVVVLVACLMVGCPITTPPPIASGAIDMRSLEPGGAGVQVHGGGGAWRDLLPYAHGSLHVDVGLPRRWALRVDAGAGALSQSGIAAGRLGLRNHVVDGAMTLGFGAGVGHLGQVVTWFWPDVEVAVGARKGRVSFSAVLRTGVSVPVPLYYDALGTGPWLHWVPELGLAIELKPEFFLTVSYQGSWGFALWYPQSMGSVSHGGTVGLMARFSAPRLAE